MKGPEKIPLEYKININDIIRKCNRCGGDGQIRMQCGHGAFGEPDFESVQCPSCNGDGFIIYSIETIKKCLHEIDIIKDKNNESHVKFWGDI